MPSFTIAPPSIRATVDISHNADFTRFGGQDVRSGDFAGRVGRSGTLCLPAKLERRRAVTHAARIPKCSERPAICAALLVFRGNNRRFNFAALTPAIPAVDREYLYGSLDRKICDQYLELFADFKYVRTFWDSAQAPIQFASDVWTDVTHPFGITSARRMASAYRFKTRSIHSPWRITRRLEDLTRIPGNSINCCASRDEVHHLCQIPCVGSRAAHFQDYNE